MKVFAHGKREIDGPIRRPVKSANFFTLWIKMPTPPESTSPRCSRKPAFSRPPKNFPPRPTSNRWRSIASFTTNRSSRRKSFGGAGEKGIGLVQAVEKSAAMERAVCEMVCRRHNSTSATIAWTGISDTPTANKAALIWEGEPAAPGKARRRTHAHLQTTASRSLPVRQCAEAQRHQERRPRHHLSADGARGGHRHAGLRPHRRGAFGGVRRVQRAIGGRPHLRFARRRWSSPPMAVFAAARSFRLKKNVDDALTLKDAAGRTAGQNDRKGHRPAPRQ